MEMDRLHAEISDSPSESSSSSSASFSRTSAGRVIAIAGDGSSIIISNPVELRSAIMLQLGQTAPGPHRPEGLLWLKSAGGKRGAGGCWSLIACRCEKYRGGCI
ncbi:hypothetical protein QQF64_033632 [Cirrhinus molitorella]|uniref:Uncharacterized protein n=1 Tax=Cirrhinus molitorella TaxID=172907 RepID=A0ABR3MUG0_9TELE